MKIYARISEISVALIIALGVAQSASAKDLSNRLGVGFSNQFGISEEIPSIQMRYYPSAGYGLSAALGVDTEKDHSRFGFMAKVIKVIFFEDNLNFYTGASAALVSQETTPNKQDSGFDLAGIVGVEFFMPGLENLGFSFETGVGVTSIASEVRFRTIGDHPLRAGIIFYF